MTICTKNAENMRTIRLVDHIDDTMRFPPPLWAILLPLFSVFTLSRGLRQAHSHLVQGSRSWRAAFRLLGRGVYRCSGVSDTTQPLQAIKTRPSKPVSCCTTLSSLSNAKKNETSGARVCPPAWRCPQSSLSSNKDGSAFSKCAGRAPA